MNSDFMKEQIKQNYKELREIIGLNGTLEEELKKSKEEIEYINSLCKIANVENFYSNEKIKKIEEGIKDLYKYE